MSRNNHEERQKMNFSIDNASVLNEYDNSPLAWRFIVKHWPTNSQYIAIFFIVLLVWGLAYTILPEYTAPNTVIMRMAFLFVGAQICGLIVSMFGLPDMLGMLFWGVFYTNIGFGNFQGYEGLESVLRELALVNIMLLAGLGLELDALKKLFGMVTRITLVPTAFETTSIAILAYLLMDMPWLWGILMGLVVTAISPNVVITVLLKLKEERLGLNKGLHTLIIAVTSCNDVIAIFLFGVVLGVIFSTGTLLEKILQGPIGIVIGIVYGFIVGLLLVFMPSDQSKYVNGLRFTMMLLGGFFADLGSKFIGYPSAGALGCITIAFVAGIGWRKKLRTKGNEIAVQMDLLWKFVKPISFSLIGKEVDFLKLDGKVVGYGFLVLFVGCLFRLLFSYVSAYGGDLNWKERAYVTISGFPKATVQAALGPVALDLARKLNSTDNMEKANVVLVVSVLSIVCTAPLGALLMVKLAPILLKKSDEETHSSADDTI